MVSKEILSGAAIALTFAGFLPYIWHILRNRVRPHVLSWVVWGVTTLIVFLAQREGGGGVGAWPIGVSALITLCIAALAYAKRADTHITASDRVFFTLAMSSLPLWYLTADPLWAVVLLTLADVAGFAPSLRKAYARPYEESPLFFSIFALRNVLALMALEHFSLTTMLFPAATGIACIGVVMILLWRRRVAPWPGRV